jgi:hypothetical protein
VGPVAGEPVALKAEIHPHFLVTGPHAAVPVQLTLFLSASLAMLGREIIQHLLEFRVFFKYGIAQQGFEPFGIDVEIAQFFFEPDAQIPDLTVYVGKAGLTAQAARGNGVLNNVRVHDMPP